jgi:hypothetical protein
MLSRTAYIRQSKKSQRFQKRVAVAVVLGVAGCAAAVMLVREPVQERMVADAPELVAGAPVLTPTAATQVAQAVRRIYPYSIVPGGVRDGAEVARMVRMDRVVAQHYASFDASKARVVKIDKPRAVYVSYRKGDKVFWSANKHTLVAGETVLSDGNGEIRTRCGNRISDTAQLPVEAHGPSEAELDSAQDASAADGVRNVSFGLEQAAGGQSYQLMTFANDAGLARAAAEPQTKSSGIGLPSAFDGVPPLTSVGAVRSVDTGSSTTPATGETPSNGSSDGGSTPVGAPDGGAGNGSPSSPGGNTGGSGDTGTGGTPGAPGTPTDIPEVLQPTEPVAPAKPVDHDQKPNEVPEPGSLWLGFAGAAALLLSRRRGR